jgi:hypothetical protein
MAEQVAHCSLSNRGGTGIRPNRPEATQDLGQKVTGERRGASGEQRPWLAGKQGHRDCHQMRQGPSEKREEGR